MSSRTNRDVAEQYGTSGQAPMAAGVIPSLGGDVPFGVRVNRDHRLRCFRRSVAVIGILGREYERGYVWRTNALGS